MASQSLDLQEKRALAILKLKDRIIMINNKQSIFNSNSKLINDLARRIKQIKSKSNEILIQISKEKNYISIQPYITFHS